ncbi:spore germination protein GerPE [Bacillus sp. B15-48]|uniref:spore germination protein GerPE n=1 Tax=Bacillus sp. B15-48 TaxID=1548601 RepID=UPI00193F0380|nr:spore germination protein GerPE [Bacillus sp. B15-48]MBM4764197.1 spore germination protein GerPE [Bacillus sp. B15-48]
MLQRTTSVTELEVNSVAIASVLHIGDSKIIHGDSRALAVQRQAEIFYGNEGHFNFPIFTEPVPLPPIEEDVQMFRQNYNPVIKIRKVDIIGISSSAVVQLGNTGHITMLNRTKHIRQLLENLH